MTADDWILLGKILGGVLVGGYFAYKLHRAEDQAKKAKEFAEPTGNGFAKTVKDSLAVLEASATAQKIATDRIELRQTQDSKMLVDHITAHANADVLKGTRGDTTSNSDTP